MRIIPQDALDRYVCVGETRLDGQIASIGGALPAAVAANAFGMGLICPFDNGPETASAIDMDILGPRSLIALSNHFKGLAILERPVRDELAAPAKPMDLREAKGQEVPKRALDVTAAGGHNLVLMGPHRSDKSMLAQRLPGILPLMNAKELLEPPRLSWAAPIFTPISGARAVDRRHESLPLRPWGVGKGTCGKAPRCLLDYQGRSRPLMDRIDLQIDVPQVTSTDLALPAPFEGSAEVAARVEIA